MQGGKLTCAWPRLAEYFARFHLSQGLKCGIEVKAPMLSPIPLIIKSCYDRLETINANSFIHRSEMHDMHNSLDGEGENEDETGKYWKNSYDADVNYDDTLTLLDATRTEEKINDPIDTEKILIKKGAQEYLRYSSIDIKNIARSAQLIHNHNGQSQKGSGPSIEVQMIIYQNSEDTIHNESDFEVETEQTTNSSPWKGKMTLIRMVNDVPLLDSADARACGLVQGLNSMKNTWAAFGLDVSISAIETQEDNNNTNPSTILHLPTFDIKDIEELDTYFRRSNHDMYEEDISENIDTIGFSQTLKRLPAGVRIGNILLIVQLRATPSQLALPTLSKVSFDMRDAEISERLIVRL